MSWVALRVGEVEVWNVGKKEQGAENGGGERRLGRLEVRCNRIVRKSLLILSQRNYYAKRNIPFLKVK